MICNFQSFSKKDETIDMFLNIRNTTLIENKYLVMPRVFIRHKVSKTRREKIITIIKQHNGEIAGKIWIFESKVII